jgi:hypothetical protein
MMWEMMSLLPRKMITTTMNKEWAASRIRSYIKEELQEVVMRESSQERGIKEKTPTENNKKPRAQSYIKKRAVILPNELEMSSRCRYDANTGIESWDKERKQSLQEKVTRTEMEYNSMKGGRIMSPLTHLPFLFLLQL